MSDKDYLMHSYRCAVSMLKFDQNPYISLEGDALTSSHRQMNRRADGQADGRADRLTDRQTVGQVETYIHPHFSVEGIKIVKDNKNLLLWCHPFLAPTLSALG